jgi:hypothetical protein
MRCTEPLQDKRVKGWWLEGFGGKRFASHNKPIRNRQLSSLLTPK